MLTMRKIIISVIAFAVSSAAFSQNVPSLIIGYDASQAAYAGAGAAAQASPYAADVNPAAMSLFPGTMSVAVSYGSWQPDAASDKLVGAGGFWRLNERFAAGAAFKYFGQPSYETVNGNGIYSQVHGKYTPKDYSVSLGVSYLLTEGVSAGLSARYLSSSLAEDATASSVMFDAAVAYFRDRIGASIALSNIGGGVKYSEKSYSLPSVLRAGASYELIEGLRGMAEADYLFEGVFMASIGGEYLFRDIVAARAGLHYGDKEKAIPTYASAGLGVKYSGFSLDASYLFASESLANTLLIGIGYSF